MQITPEQEDTVITIVDNLINSLNGHEFHLGFCALTFVIGHMCKENEYAANAELLAWVVEGLDKVKTDIIKNAPGFKEVESKWLN